MSDTEEADVKKDDFEARDYQVQLAEMAFQSNKIIFLPTGSGKTFISVMVMAHFLQKNDCGSKEVGKGGKRAFFLVNTVALVQQQVDQIKDKTPFCVSGYCGYMQVDFWSKEKWEGELEKNGILVMTAEIFKNLLLTNVITLKDVAVTVFDECHHAVDNHPMRQIMQQFKEVPVNDQPRVLGLTATLINRNLKLNDVEKEVKTLETTFLSQIATADNEAMVNIFSTNPQEFKVRFVDHNKHERAYATRDRLFSQWSSFISTLQIDDGPKPDKSIKPIGAFQIDDNSKKTNKELKNVITDIQVNMDELGLYGGQISVLARLIQLQKIIHNCESETSKTIFNVVASKLVLLRKYFELEMGKKSEFELINQYASNKVHSLLGILKKFKEKDSAIVFVKRRFTAKILQKIVSKAADADPKLKHIKCDFVVGYNIANPFKDTRENIIQKTYNDRVLDKFNSGLLNVMIGSNVVEEGMDVSNCNTVIMFDAPLDFRAYVQSKGRARHSTSRYIILTSDPTYEERYAKFCQVEGVLRKLLCRGQYLLRSEPSKDEVDATLFANIEGLEPYQPLGRNGPCITALSAISHINRYLASLKTDKFTQITPYWYMKVEGARYKCYLHLPTESKVSGLIEGTFQSSKENAKRSVALVACRKLHEQGELDQEHLLPITEETRTVSGCTLLPNWDSTEEFHVGTKKSKRSWLKSWPDCLTGCMPAPDKPVYVHVIQHTVLFNVPPDNSRLTYFHMNLSKPVTYAILSSKKLPQLAPFPLYMSTGELEINILEAQTHNFSRTDLAKISLFHGTVFDRVCGTVKGSNHSFLIRDYSNQENSYLIAPVLVDGANQVKVDWKVIEEANEPFPIPDIQPSDEERKSLVVNDDNYLGMIITPWYRQQPAVNYIVTKVCHDMSENSDFPSDSYRTYKDYFADKYKISPLIHQPLLEVRALSSRMNNLKPGTLTQALKNKNKNENEELEVVLLPEFCHKFPLPGWYWVKALLLPSVLHRMAKLCAAEELRVKLVRDIHIGAETLSRGQLRKKLEADESIKKKMPNEVAAQLLTPLRINFKKPNPGPSNPSLNFPGGRDPSDLYNDMENETLFDVIYKEEFCKEPIFSNFDKVEIPKKAVTKFVQPPLLKMLQKKVSDPGPEQIQILQAITAAVADDVISCERLETLGDSFLKFAISLILFETQQDLTEGCLTNLKGQAVGNRNLYFCGRNKKLGTILEVKQFSPRQEWVPPQFCVEETIRSVIIDACLDPSCLFKMNIPEEDVVSGKISDEVRQKIKVILMNAEDLKGVQTNVFTNQLALTDKNISDAVEAVLGVYLENSGMFGALRAMNWFGVIDQELAKEKVFRDKISTPRCGTRGLPSDHLLCADILEDILHYKFQDRAYLLQAVTHPSYHLNFTTKNYQRLEFLGDAIIDFLITIHIYESCKELHPGDLTDLRSALVNNITLGCITVRYGLQSFLLHRSKPLHDIIARFVKHQKERHHKVDNDILFLCEEKESLVAEAIEVPKALGDLFEALIGAIYLDSGKDMDVTWKVMYNLMQREIESFRNDVPKNHVRQLFESNCQPFFRSKVDKDGVVLVQVEVLHQGEKILCNGFGDNKYQAKRAAAKQALRRIRSSLPQ